MKQALRLSIAVLALAVGASAQTAPAMPTKPSESGPVGLLGDLSKDWAAQKETMIAIADAMPQDKFGFRPTAAQRTYAEQILHVASVNVALMRILDPSAAAPTIDEHATSKPAVLKALTGAYEFGLTALRSQTDASILQVVTNAPAFLGPSTRARLVYYAMIHAEDEYGVMTVYLRLNDIVPPASRRGGL